MLEDGRIVEVVAAPEPLAEIRPAEGQALARLAWHLGNRHLPTEILAKSLRIRRDPVIEAMAEGLGARLVQLEAPFNPEGGAYAKAEAEAHDHGHHLGHDHPDHHHHDHEDHGHHHDRAHEHGHAHHDHDHGHDR
jgi:urease accessory protein